MDTGSPYKRIRLILGRKKQIILSGNKFLIPCLPFWRNDTEEDEIGGACIVDILPGTRRDNDYLPRTEGSMFGINVHIPESAEDVVKFRGALQEMGQRRLSGRDDGMGDAAPEVFCSGDFIRVQKFAQDGAVDNAFMGAGGTITDDHGRFSFFSWSLASMYFAGTQYLRGY
jgi:hypothetical protein